MGHVGDFFTPGNTPASSVAPFSLSPRRILLSFSPLALAIQVPCHGLPPSKCPLPSCCFCPLSGPVTTPVHRCQPLQPLLTLLCPSHLCLPAGPPENLELTCRLQSSSTSFPAGCLAEVTRGSRESISGLSLCFLGICL